MDICEYVKDAYGFWQYREFRGAIVFEQDLHRIYSKISSIRLGLTSTYRVRVTKWQDIHFHLREYLTPKLLDQHEHNHMFKIGDDFFIVCDEQEHITHRRKTKTFFMRYLEPKTTNIIDLMLS